METRRRPSEEKKRSVVARKLYGSSPLADAVRATIKSLPDEEGGVGGLIALDRAGKHAFGLSQNSAGMFRGYVTGDGRTFVAIYAEEEPKEIKGQAEQPQKN
jgi:isoaspartyl peptidase/L-asparaginase-like protein (Ntn-hydrolase superfamily)